MALASLRDRRSAAGCVRDAQRATPPHATRRVRSFVPCATGGIDPSPFRNRQTRADGRSIRFRHVEGTQMIRSSIVVALAQRVSEPPRARRAGHFVPGYSNLTLVGIGEQRSGRAAPRPPQRTQQAWPRAPGARRPRQILVVSSGVDRAVDSSAFFVPGRQPGRAAGGRKRRRSYLAKARKRVHRRSRAGARTRIVINVPE